MAVQVMTFTPSDGSSEWAQSLVGALNSVTGYVESFLNGIGVPVEFGEFYVKDGAGYLPLATVGVQLSKSGQIGALLSGVAMLLWTLTKIGFLVKVVDVVSNPAGNIGAFLLIGLGIAVFAFAKGRK